MGQTKDFGTKCLLKSLTSFPTTIADFVVISRSFIYRSRFQLGGSRNEVRANCLARIGVRRRNEFGSASKRGNVVNGRRPPRRAGSGHGAAERHDGRTTSDADERALSEALSATRASSAISSVCRCSTLTPRRSAMSGRSCAPPAGRLSLSSVAAGGGVGSDGRSRCRWKRWAWKAGNWCHSICLPANMLQHQLGMIRGPHLCRPTQPYASRFPEVERSFGERKSEIRGQRREVAFWPVAAVSALPI